MGNFRRKENAHKEAATARGTHVEPPSADDRGTSGRRVIVVPPSEAIDVMRPGSRRRLPYLDEMLGDIERGVGGTSSGRPGTTERGAEEPTVITVPPEEALDAMRTSRTPLPDYLERMLADLRGYRVIDVPVQEGVRIGGRVSEMRQPPHFLDQELATSERGCHSGIRRGTNAFLLSTARSRNRFLFHPPSAIGPCLRIAIAETLILIYQEMSRRFDAAPRDRNMLPIVEGIEWDFDDPLAGLLESVVPFNMHEVWQQIAQEHSACTTERPTPEPVPPPRRRVPPGPTAVVEWHAQRMGNEASSRFAPILPGTRIDLDGTASRDPHSRRLSYDWRMQLRPAHSRANIARPNASQTRFIGDVQGEYRIILTVRTVDGAIDRALAVITIGHPRPEPAPPTPPREERDDWLRRARRDTRRLTLAARRILIQYPHLHNEYLPEPRARELQIDGSTTLYRVHTVAARYHPRTFIDTYLYSHVTRDYEHFCRRVQQFRAEVHASAHRIEAEVSGCEQCVTQSCMIIKYDWYVPLQSNAHSVYYFSATGP